MGQSAKMRPSARQFAKDRPSLSIFATPLGWFGLLGDAGQTGDNCQVNAVYAGHRTAAEVVSRAEGASVEFEECDWHPVLRHRLERYCSGVRVDFDDISLALPAMTVFQRRIISCVRRVGYGQTITYGELAERAGFPRAARAVGTVMASNRFPILIPCHRVLASGGRLGGYSSPQGIDLKRRLLDMESEGAATRTINRTGITAEIARRRPR